MMKNDILIRFVPTFLEVLALFYFADRIFSYSKSKQNKTVYSEYMFLFVGLLCNLLLSRKALHKVCNCNSFNFSMGKVYLSSTYN